MKQLETLDNLQDALLKEKSKKEIPKVDESKYHFNKLSMLCREDYKVGEIVIHQPTIGDIVSFGEDEFYDSLSPFILNSTSIRLFLWENGIDWTETKDIEVFAYLIKTIDTRPLTLLFGDLKFEEFELKLFKSNSEDEKPIFLLINEKEQLCISEVEFMEIANYIREMFNSHPKEEKPSNNVGKKWIIEEEKMNKAMSGNKKEKKSSLYALISTYIMWFKCSAKDLKNVGIYEFVDSIKRMQIYESTRALLQGSYSGFADLSKVDEEKFNFMRDE